MGLTQGLHRAVQHSPALPATICDGRIRTWVQSADRIARFAGALVGLGVRPGDRVAMLSLNSDYYHEYLLAVPWAGAVLNPLNTQWSVPAIAFSLVDSQTRVLIVDDTFADLAASFIAECPELRFVIHCGPNPSPPGLLAFDDLVSRHEPVEDAQLSEHDTAGVFYTEDATGAPKGVALSHGGLLTSALGFIASGDTMTSAGVLLHLAPMFHLADIGAWVARNCVGGGHVMLPAFDAVSSVEAIRRFEVTDLSVVPTMLQILAEHPAAAEADLRTVEYVVYGGSPISASLIERVEAMMPMAKLVQTYGMTELSPVISVLDAEGHANTRLRRSAGRAAPHVQIRIVDADDVEVPVGSVGEVTVRGGGLMLGYWNQPERTADVLRNGWVHTGDAAYMDECGYIFVVDRLKDVIVTGGGDVYSAEVENALMKHPAVANCAVIGVPDQRWGQRVHAVVVAQQGTLPTSDELKGHCRTLIANYKTPHSFEFVSELPLSGSGKVLKQQLRATHWPAGDRAVQ